MTGMSPENDANALEFSLREENRASGYGIAWL